jgi:hypothetical protein
MHRRLLAALAIVLAAHGCSFSGLQFSQDERIAFEEPGYREKVRLPLTVRWTVEKFEVTGPTDTARGDAGYFAVLLDVDPLPAGETLRYYARDDRACRPDAGCLDAKYLAERRIHTTTDTKLVVAELGPAPGIDVENGDRDLHEVTIVLLDGKGRRIGESLWTQTFEILR